FSTAGHTPPQPIRSVRFTHSAHPSHESRTSCAPARHRTAPQPPTDDFLTENTTGSQLESFDGRVVGSVVRKSALDQFDRFYLAGSNGRIGFAERTLDLLF